MPTAHPSPAQLRFQRAVVQRLVDAGHQKDDIAAVAGVGDTQVSKWITEGEQPRKMDVIELDRLMRHYGRDVVLGAEQVTSERIEDLRGEGLQLVGDAHQVAAFLHAALVDDTLDRKERAELARLLGKLSGRGHRIARAS